MRHLLSIWSICVVAAKRLVSLRGLALAVALGLVVTVALAVSLPVYADAVNYRMLQRQLTTVPGSTLTVRSPFTFIFRYSGSRSPALEWADLQAVDAYLGGPAGAELGLPRRTVVRYAATDKLQLFAAEGFGYADTRQALDWIEIGSISELEPHVTLLEGHFPAAAAHDSAGPIEVLVSEALATKTGVQAGEDYIVLDTNRVLGAGALTQLPVRVAGIWKAKDPQADFWFYNPAAFEGTLLAPPGTFSARLSGFSGAVYSAAWSLVMDGSSVTANNTAALLGRITRVQGRASGYLPGLRLDVSPADALVRYQEGTLSLSILLYAFSVPIIGLIFAFIGLVAGLTVERQRSEIAIFRSRGATTAQVLGITVAESLILAVVALVVGLPAGMWVARLIGRTRSFLDFSAAGNMDVSLTTLALQFGLVLLGLALAAQTLPAFGAARHTIVTYKHERARALRAPWWQRAWLDVLLLVPAGYGFYVLRRQGQMALPGMSEAAALDPLQNPLFFLVPALGIFALTLLILRLVPPLMAAAGWLAARTRSVSLLLTVRYLSRSRGPYTAPLALLILTLSLSTYTATLAQTLDDHMYDQAYYQVGADMRVTEMGQAILAGGLAPGGGEPPVAAGGQEWRFLPVSEHLKVPGVRAVARVARFDAASSLNGNHQNAVMLGVDRADFSRVAWWRRDFSPVSLGTLMNALARARNGVLVPLDFMAENALAVGDTFRATVQAAGAGSEIDFKIVGYFRYFPTWYPGQDTLFVGNLDYLFERLGGQFPYDVWMKIAPNQDPERITADMGKLGLAALSYDAVDNLIGAEVRRPERQGLFGLLSVGFSAASVLTVLGFMMYALFSFRRRFIELGILRAIGLSPGQMTALLASELAALILGGLVAGTALGAWVSKLFIPYLQVGPAGRVPPFLITINWPAILRVYVLLALLFVVTLATLAVLLMRMRIFQAVKLGETT